MSAPLRAALTVPPDGAWKVQVSGGWEQDPHQGSLAAARPSEQAGEAPRSAFLGAETAWAPRPLHGAPAWASKLKCLLHNSEPTSTTQKAVSSS